MVGITEQRFKMERIYNLVLLEHLKKYNQMFFLNGPRQVGKTTLTKSISKEYQNFYYLNWDDFKIQQAILSGQNKIAELANLNKLTQNETIIVFDEIHKYSQWKNFLKGFFDIYKDKCKIIVTGSSKLDVYRKGGDSMMGRYFLYTMFPLTIGELTNRPIFFEEIRPPYKISEQEFDSLWNNNGFPEAFAHNNKAFTNRWKKLRNSQLFREDIRDLTKVHEVGQLELMADMIKLQVGQLFNRSELAKKVQVSVPTISKWMNYLQMFFHCFEVKPWSRNISRSLIKEPKLYLYDYSVIDDVGAKFENFIALHLKKFVQFYNDLGYGEYELYFLRNKEQKEVDFLVVKNAKPWFIVEAKYSSNQALTKNLFHFQKESGAEHAFQVVFDLDFVDKDCFVHKEPIIVPAKTFLSQLV